mgnify:CR=1 FL=1
MESLGKLKDDFLVKKLEEESNTIDFYAGLDAVSQSDLSAEVSTLRRSDFSSHVCLSLQYPHLRSLLMPFNFVCVIFPISLCLPTSAWQKWLVCVCSMTRHDVRRLICRRNSPRWRTVSQLAAAVAA